MWLLKTHSAEKRLFDNYMPLSCLIGGWERSLRSSFRAGDLARSVLGVSECVCGVCVCTGGMSRGFRKSST